MHAFHRLPARDHPRSGFSLLEVALILAIIASLALPSLMATRITAERSANEAVALRNLGTLAVAEAECSARMWIDSDGDGVGEYGYLGELTGRVPVRVLAGGEVASGSWDFDVIQPAVLDDRFGRLAEGVVVVGGYVYRCFLPGEDVDAIAEAASGGFARESIPSPDGCERRFAIVCWPARPGISGRRAFLITETHEVYVCDNAGEPGAQPRCPDADDVVPEGGWPQGPLFRTRSGCGWKLR